MWNFQRTFELGLIQPVVNSVEPVAKLQQAAGADTGPSLAMHEIPELTHMAGTESRTCRLGRSDKAFYWIALWCVLISAAPAQEPQTVVFEPRAEYCIDEPEFELHAESFDFRGGDLRAMAFNIHTGIGGYSAATQGGISTQYTMPDLWPLITEEIAERIHRQNVDIFGLQEVLAGRQTVRDGFTNKRDSRQGEIIKETLNELEGAAVWDYQYWVHNVGQSGSSTAGNWWGVATFYRAPWSLVGDAVAFPTSSGSDTKAMIKTTLTNGQRTIDVFTAHFDVDLPEPEDGSIQYSERNAAPFIAAAENPVLLIGDLNVEPQHRMPDGTLQLKPIWDLGLVDSAVSAGVVSRHGLGPGPNSLHTRQNAFGGSSKRIDWVVLEEGEFLATGVEVYRAQDDPSTTMPSPHPSIAAGVNAFPEQQATSYISDHHAFIADLSMRGNATGLPITFGSTNQEIISVAGSTATIRRTGTVSLAAVQEGNDAFLQSPRIRREIRVRGPQAIVLEESFETDGEGDRYHVFGSGQAFPRAYFNRRMGDHIFAPTDGQWFFGGENIDGQSGHTGYDDGDSALDDAGKGAVVFLPVPTNGISNFELSVSVAASDPGGFDLSRTEGDKLSIEVRSDDGPFVEIARFNGTGSNSPLVAPNGAVVTTEFVQWTFPFVISGEMLQLRIVVRSTSGIGNEVLAFDQVRLIGFEDVLPEDLPPVGGACNPIPGREGWFESPWFGAYSKAFAPWLYHGRHQFIYLDPSSTPSAIFYFDPILNSWIYTAPTVYPNLYFFDGQGWLYFFDDSEKGRVFYRYQDQSFHYYE